MSLVRETIEGPSASFSSCPNEILSRIICYFGPYLTSYQRKEYWTIYDLDIISLKRLTLVSKRLRPLAEAELYRAPHTVFARRGDYLTSEHVNIYPKAAVHAEALWVLGSATFFARLFSMGFQRLTWLNLMFGIPGRGHSEECGSFDITDSASMTMLANTLQTLQLRHLEVHYQHTVPRDWSNASHGIRLVAGHPTLQTFVWSGPRRPGISETGPMKALPITRTTRNLHTFHCENVKNDELSWIFTALGDLPALFDFTLARQYSHDVLFVIPDRIAQQLTQLRLYGTFPDPMQLTRLDCLAKYQNLQVLAFGDLLQHAKLDPSILGQVCLPHIRHLESTSELAFDTNIALCRWARDTSLLPRLQTLHIRREGTGASLSWPDMAESVMMGSILDELLAARQGLELTPVKIRQRMENRLRRYRAFQEDEDVG